jgi:hypothetical protein
VRGAYFDHSKTLAEKLRPSKDQALQLEEKRKEIESHTRMLDEVKKELATAQSTQKTEQTTISDMKNKKIQEEKKLQLATTDFEDKQLGFMSDVIALEGKIDAMTKLPSRMSADHGKALQQVYNKKIKIHQVPLLLEDAKVIKAVPLALRVLDKTESQSMRSNRMTKPASTQ